MDLLKRIDKSCLNNDKLAIKTLKETLSYKKVKLIYEKLSLFFWENLPQDNSPIIIYGNNHCIHILPIFIACLKSNHTYLPIDDLTPLERINDIINDSSPSLFINLTNNNYNFKNIDLTYITRKKFLSICKNNNTSTNKFSLKPKIKSIAYIIYTSGSTGKPKGVMISYKSLNSFSNWLYSKFSFLKKMMMKFYLILPVSLLTFQYFL